jgi:hypothetical protein
MGHANAGLVPNFSAPVANQLHTDMADHMWKLQRKVLLQKLSA